MQVTISHYLVAPFILWHLVSIYHKPSSSQQPQSFWASSLDSPRWWIRSYDWLLDYRYLQNRGLSTVLPLLWCLYKSAFFIQFPDHWGGAYEYIKWQANRISSGPHNHLPSMYLPAPSTFPQMVHQSLQGAECSVTMALRSPSPYLVSCTCDKFWMTSASLGKIPWA